MSITLVTISRSLPYPYQDLGAEGYSHETLATNTVSRAHMHHRTSILNTVLTTPPLVLFILPRCERHSTNPPRTLFTPALRDARSRSPPKLKLFRRPSNPLLRTQLLHQHSHK